MTYDLLIFLGLVIIVVLMVPRGRRRVIGVLKAAFGKSASEDEEINKIDE